MLVELQPDQYSLVLPLFRPLDFNLVIRSVAEGNTPAWVFADNPALPQLAVLWDRQDALMVAGDPHSPQFDQVRQVIADRIVVDASARGIPELALFYPPGWETVLPGLLRGLELQPAGRISYRLADPRFSPPTFSGLRNPPAGFELRRIDDSLLASTLVHLGEVRGWIDSFWPAPEDFLHTGFGYCAIIGDTIASWCLTVFAAGNERELGLATIPSFRRRGLATLVAAASVEHGLAHELFLHWHCWADNRPSAVIAEKVGFVKERDYNVYRVKVSPA